MDACALQQHDLNKISGSSWSNYASECSCSLWSAPSHVSFPSVFFYLLLGLAPSGFQTFFSQEFLRAPCACWRAHFVKNSRSIHILRSLSNPTVNHARKHSQSDDVQLCAHFSLALEHILSRVFLLSLALPNSVSHSLSYSLGSSLIFSVPSSQLFCPFSSPRLHSLSRWLSLHLYLNSSGWLSLHFVLDILLSWFGSCLLCWSCCASFSAGDLDHD